MKRLLLVCALSACLFSCSLLQRHTADDEEEIRDLEPVAEENDGPLFDANGQEIDARAGKGGKADNEVARLNTKIAALETKVDVLSANLEKVQAQRSQPIIEAERARPQPNMAVPVEAAEEAHDQSPQISAAPTRPTAPPSPPKSAEPTAPAEASASGVEKDFRAGMQLFQNGKHQEAALRFSQVAKKYPSHLLASHALYWAGEANMRGQQTSLATENWLELEKRYPRSAYLPEALAGLAKAFEAQGDSAKAKQYRSLVLRSFPKSPVALRMEPGESAPMRASKAPSGASYAPEEEQAPIFEGGEEDSALPETENQ
jgi:TolA-binding protein